MSKRKKKKRWTLYDVHKKCSERLGAQKLDVVPTNDIWIPKNIVIYKSELEFMSRCILDSKRIETGGQLFGFYTPKGVPVVCYAIGPGRRANHQVTFFNQDVEYLKEIGQRLSRDFGLHHIGEWHSHHQLGLSHPSGHDTRNMQSCIDNLHLGKFLLCIGTCDEETSTINAFNFTEGNKGYSEALWTVKPTDSPYRAVIDYLYKDMIIHPRTETARFKNLKIAGLYNRKQLKS